MNLHVESLDTHEARLTIDVEPAVFEQTRREVAKNLSKQVRLPGFRPGMAPMNVVIAAVGNDAFLEEVGDALARKLYPQAIDESKLEPYGPGQIEKINLDPPQIVARVPLEPTVDLKDYQSIRLPSPDVVVTDADIESQLDMLREDNAIIELVERPAEMGDMVEADIVGHLDDEQVMNQRRARIVLNPERLNVPALAEALVGSVAGEHKHADVVFPDDFDREELRGQTVACHIDVIRVNRRTLPEINDELAQTVGSFASLAELREDVQQRLHEMSQRQADQQYANTALETFTNLASVSYPPSFLDDRLNDMLKDYKDDVQRAGLPWDEWIKMTNKTEDEVRDELRPSAEARAKTGLVMRQIAVEEKLVVSDDEASAEFEREQQLAKQNRVNLKRDKASLQAARNNVLSNKVIARMVAIAKGETPTLS